MYTGAASTRTPEEATMTMQPGAGPAIPAVAAAAGQAAEDQDDTTAGSTDDGVPVGEADAEADARRSGADEDSGGILGGGAAPFAGDAEEGNRTDDGMPVGEADAEADRARSTGDDDRD
jgi:hypothetical protein